MVPFILSADIDILLLLFLLLGSYLVVYDANLLWNISSPKSSIVFSGIVILSGIIYSFLSFFKIFSISSLDILKSTPLTWVLTVFVSSET